MATGAVLCLVTVMTVSARVRFLVVFVGGLLVFQSEGVGATKFAYLAAAILAVSLSLVRLGRSREPLVMAFRPLLPASVSLILVLGASAFVARGAGASMTNWFRDVLPYFLVALLPAVGLDAAQDLSRKHAERLLVVAGSVASVGFAIDWLNRRGVSALGLGRIVLATTTLAALGFAYTITKAGLGPHRLRWLMAASAIMTVMLVNGSRTNVVLLAATLGVVGSRAKVRVPFRRIVVLILQLGAAVTITLPFLAAALIREPDFIGQRISGVVNVITGQATADQSYMARQQSYALARQTFLHFPLFGIGPGHLYATEGFYSMSLDTPWLMPAKLGLIGVTAIVIYLLATAACVRRVRKLAGWSTLVTVGRGWAAFLVALIPFGPWIEDKGFALALTLYVAVLVATSREALAAQKAQNAPEYVPAVDSLVGGRLHAPQVVAPSRMTRQRQPHAVASLQSRSGR